MFVASEELGIPEDVDRAALARQYDEEQEATRLRRAIVTSEQSDWILSLLTEPATAVEDWPGSSKRSPHFDSLRDEWNEAAQRLRDAMARGGTLWRWSTPGPSWEAMCGECGFAVVNEGRVTACMVTARN